MASARGLCEPVLLFGTDSAEQAPLVLRTAQKLAEVHVFDDVVPEKVRPLGLAGVTTFHDRELETTDALRNALGLPGGRPPREPLGQVRPAARAAHRRGVDRALRARRLRRRLPGRRAGPRRPRRPQAPPGRGQHSARLRPCEDAAERETKERTAWRGLVDEQFIPSVPHPGGPGWLGSYVSVETVSDGRGHHHTAVMDKLPLSVVDEVGRLRAHAVRETGDIFPSALPEASLTRVRELVSRTLDVLGVRWRVSHTEVKLSRRARRLSR